jgi:hypothetical protein
MFIKIKEQGLRFDNYCWNEYVKKVDWENLAGSSNQAAMYGAMKASAYFDGVELPTWRDAGVFITSLEIEEMQKFVAAFEAMNEWKQFLDLAKQTIEEQTPAEAKKKPLKESKKTLKQP